LLDSRGEILAPAPIKADLDFLRAQFSLANRRPEIRNPHLESVVSASTKSTAKPSSVLIIATRERTPRVMLTKRQSGIRFGGHLCFPGGRAEDRETVIQTALRESEEEIGLPANEVEVLGSFGHYFSQAGYRIDPVVGIVDPAFNYQPDASEVASIHWIGLQEMLDPKSYKLTRMGQDRAYFGFDNDEIHIGGPTVSLMIGLLEWLAQNIKAELE
jgi:8-oxo-dGTP pyrophosphatase MutT (NUDIX family)